MKHIFLFICYFVVIFNMQAQSVAINNDGSAPQNSAMLDVNNPNKGILIPRVPLLSNIDQTTIPAPAVSLLIYNTNTTSGNNAVRPGYYYWNGISWLQIATTLGSVAPGSVWSVNGNSTLSDQFNFIGNIDNIPLNFRVNNQKAGRIDSTLRNTFFGYQAGNLTVGSGNTATGFQALFNNGGGVNNVANGLYALYSNNSGNHNTAVGRSALSQNQFGNNNTAIGSQAMDNNMNGSNNTALGRQASQFNTIGNNNVAVGIYALNQNTQNSNIVAVGDSALFNLNGGQGYNTALGSKAGFMSMDGAYNTYIGSQAAYNSLHGTRNCAIGASSLFSNVTGSGNAANGYNSQYSNTSGNGNTTSGYYALYSDSSGSYNTAIGPYSLLYTVTGSGNIGIGTSALSANVSGSNMIAIGDSALINQNGGVGLNTAVGTRAGFNNTTGSGNNFVGYSAGYANTTGSNNAAFGIAALATNNSGNKNTAIGDSADVSVATLTNATAIGFGTIVDASNKVRIGNTSVTVIEGQVAFSNLSDARFKYNVQENVPGLNFIMKLRPVTYYIDEDKVASFSKTGLLQGNVYPSSFNSTALRHTGFLAQDVEAVADQLGYVFDGIHKPVNERDHYSLAYSQFIMPLVKSVQEQQDLISLQNEKIAQLLKENSQISEELVKLTKKVDELIKK